MGALALSQSEEPSLPLSLLSSAYQLYETLILSFPLGIFPPKRPVQGQTSLLLPLPTLKPEPCEEPDKALGTPK